MDSLEESLETIDSKEEYSQLEICELYEVINGMEVYAILNIDDKDIMDMLRPFSIMMQENKTVIFLTVWDKHVKKQVAELSLTEVATNVWALCFQEITEVVEKFHARSITLEEIDHYLKDIPLQDLEQEIVTLVEGCNKCLNLTASNTWVVQFVVAVNSYWSICQVQHAAELVLKAKDALMLTGDFAKLENLREKVLCVGCILFCAYLLYHVLQISEHMTLSLETFEGEGYHDIEGLKNIASSHDQMEFLKVLSNCQSFIEWLQQETTGNFTGDCCIIYYICIIDYIDVIELQTLIGLSMFEEDPCTMDRIAQLHTVGSAIAPLVYDLLKNSDFDEFLTNFSAMNVDVNLTTLLVSYSPCNMFSSDQ